MNFFNWEKRVVKHQKSTANDKEQITEVNDFSAFLCMGISKNLGSFENFP